MPSHNVKTTCLTCSMTFPFAANVGSHVEPPSDGDVSLCIECRSFGVLEPDNHGGWYIRQPENIDESMRVHFALNVMQMALQEFFAAGIYNPSLSEVLERTRKYPT